MALPSSPAPLASSASSFASDSRRDEPGAVEEVKAKTRAKLSISPALKATA